MRHEVAKSPETAATNHYQQQHFPTQELLPCPLGHRLASGLCRVPPALLLEPLLGPSLLPTLPAGSQDLRP